MRTLSSGAGIALVRLAAAALVGGGATGCGAVTPPAHAIVPGPADAVHVHIASAFPATLVATDASGESSVACSAPCDRAIDTTHRTFTIGTGGHPSTPDFRIPPAQRGIVLHFEPDPIGVPLGIGLLLVPGAAAMGVGGVVALLDASGREDFSGLALPGAIVAGVGLHFVVAGVVVALVTGSDVTLEEATKKVGQGIPLDW